MLFIPAVPELWTRSWITWNIWSDISSEHLLTKDLLSGNHCVEDLQTLSAFELYKEYLIKVLPITGKK